MDNFSWDTVLSVSAAGLGIDALKAQAPRPRSVPPSLGYYGAGSYLPGAGHSPHLPGSNFNYLRDVGRLDLNSTVMLCLGWCRDNFPQAQYRIGKQVKTGPEAGKYEPDMDHWSMALLRRPNPNWSWREMLGLFLAGYKIDGNAYFVKVRGNGGMVVELWPLPNCIVTVVGSDDPRRPIDRYELSTSPGSSRPFAEYPPEDIVHVRDGVDPENPILGIGKLKAMLREIAGLNNAATYTASVLRNAHAGRFLVPKQSVGTVYESSTEENELIAVAGKMNHGLTREHAGRVEYSTVPMELITIGMGPEEMSLDSITDGMEARVAACFAPGLSMVLGLPGSAATRTYANLGESRRHAWDDGLMPVGVALAEGLQTQLIYRYDHSRFEWVPEDPSDGPDLECWFDYSEVSALREDEAEKVQTWAVPWDADGMRLDEFRDKIGLAPEGGDRGGMFKSELTADMQPEPEMGEGEDFGGDPFEEEEFPDDDDDDVQVRDEERREEGDEAADEPVKARGGGAKKKGGGKKKGGKTGRPECSNAMSAIARRVASPEDYRTAGRCRAGANSQRRADIQRSAGNEQTARAIEKFGLSTRKERVARVKDVLAKVRAGNATGAKPSAAKPLRRPERTVEEIARRRRTAARLRESRADRSKGRDPSSHTDHEPGHIGEMRSNLIKFDPTRFQYKLEQTNAATGSVGSLAGVKKWDPELAGVVQVWKDPADGGVYVVNGHNRLELANKLGVEKVAVRFITAKDAGEARAKGALTNIAEGRGTSIDAAKFFRDTGIQKSDLEARGIPLTEAKADQGLALAGLANPLFRKVVYREMPAERGAIIGGSGLSHDQQMKVAELSDKRRGEVNNATLREIVDEVRAAPTRQSGGGGLFGDDPQVESLAVYRASLTARVKERLGREKKLFGTVARERSAADLARGGNVIDTEASGAISRQAGEALATFDRLKRTSVFSDPLNEAAERLASSGAQRERKRIEDDLYKQVVERVRDAYRF